MINEAKDYSKLNDADNRIKKKNKREGLKKNEFSKKTGMMVIMTKKRTGLRPHYAETRFELKQRLACPVP